MAYDNSVFQLPINRQLHKEVPPLMVGFDTETTGLTTKHSEKCENCHKKSQGLFNCEHCGIHKGFLDEPVSYGLVVYRDGKISHGESTHFIVRSSRDSSEEAKAVHGFDLDKLSRSYHGEIVKDRAGNEFAPALPNKTGVMKMANMLGDYQRQGAVFVGANPMYDVDMITRTFVGHHNAPINTTGFRPERAKMVDVIAHDRLIRPTDNYYPDGHPLRDSRSLSSLSNLYGVKPGDHTAMDDSRATIDVFLKQIELNQRGGRPHPRDVMLAKLPKIGAKIISDAGIDYSLLHPCTGKKDCPACKHLEKVLLTHTDAENGDPDHAKTVKKVLKTHKDMKGITYNSTGKD